MRWDLVSFDFWRTLFVAPMEGSRARHMARVAAYARALAALPEVPADHRIGEVMLTEWGNFNAVHTGEERTLSNLERVVWLAEQLGVECPTEPALAELLVALEDSIFAGPPVLLQGMAELLHELAERVPVVLISDTSFSTGRNLRRLLEVEGIAGCFTELVFSDEVGRSKPHAAVFEAATRSLAAPPSRAIHIGDREDTDVRGALRAGWDAVLFLAAVEEARGRPWPETGAHHTVDTVAALRELLLEG